MKYFSEESDIDGAEGERPWGTELRCKSWQQEAALRMLLNNLDPEVAEDPARLVVYGGTGKAARNHEALAAIIRSLQELENDETLLIQSGKPVGVFVLHELAPRVCCPIPCWFPPGRRGKTSGIWKPRA